MDFSDRLVKARESIETESGKTFTQEQLAEAIGTSLDNVSNWEQGRCKPREENLNALCDFFHCDKAYLNGEIDTKTHDTEFIHSFTGLSEKSIERLTSLLSISNGDNIPDTKDDRYKYESGQTDKATLTLEFINFLLEDDYSFAVLAEDMRLCYAKYSFYQAGAKQYEAEENTKRAISIAKQMKLQEANITDEQMNDRYASYESKCYLAQEHYGSIMDEIIKILYEKKSH